MFSGPKLRKIREEKRYTIAALARETGLHWVTISVYERGKQDPGANALRKIALALGVSMDEFFEDGSPERIRPLKPVIQEIEDLAKRRRLNLPKNIYPLFLFQEALGIENNEIFANILLALAKGRIIELVPIFPRDIKEGMRIYQIPGLSNKKYYSFTIVGS